MTVWLGRFDDVTPGSRRVLEFNYQRTGLPDGVTVVSTAWSCAVAADSEVDDPDASTRLTGDTAIDAVIKLRVTNVFQAGAAGDGVNGVDYMITCMATMSDGQRIPLAGSLLCKAPA